ncbi:hypothetical protein J6590_064925 [Homalodisca vitripennis]|nr:hypothetical protein J6590_064925 [Homalodisca vitripennis]
MSVNLSRTAVTLPRETRSLSFNHFMNIVSYSMCSVILSLIFDIQHGSCHTAERDEVTITTCGDCENGAMGRLSGLYRVRSLLPQAAELQLFSTLLRMPERSGEIKRASALGRAGCTVSDPCMLRLLSCNFSALSFVCQSALGRLSGLYRVRSLLPQAAELQLFSTLLHPCYLRLLSCNFSALSFVCQSALGRLSGLYRVRSLLPQGAELQLFSTILRMPERSGESGLYRVRSLHAQAAELQLFSTLLHPCYLRLLSCNFSALSFVCQSTLGRLSGLYRVRSLLPQAAELQLLSTILRMPERSGESGLYRVIFLLPQAAELQLFSTLLRMPEHSGEIKWAVPCQILATSGC